MNAIQTRMKNTGDPQIHKHSYTHNLSCTVTYLFRGERVKISSVTANPFKNSARLQIPLPKQDGQDAFQQIREQSEKSFARLMMISVKEMENVAC